jgi:hypothetical protein
MPPRCRVCPREDRERIDADLIAGRGLRDIAGQTGTSRSALDRHRAHVSERVARAHDAQEVASADSLLGKLADLEGRATALLDKSEKRGQLGVSVAALRELRGVVELLARVTGELKGGAGGLTINVLGNPQFLVLQQKVVAALEDFPEARARVVAALAGADA